MVLDGQAGKMLNLREVASLLHVHPNTLRRWSNQGIIKSHRVNKRGDRRFMQEEVVRVLKKILQGGITILLTEQYAKPIMPIIDRGYIVENGTLVFAGTRDELNENPEVKSAYLGM